ncbi:MAG: 3-hydroxyacyl-CoA dehydrogenase NAD-binding domain-containing protein, partial [Planctomycetota bacterium]|nr:3-hydroxyacyl-CoA dehydrogenase NAD-binding domain-containing protein [Planctomycetota bacterium]
MPYTFRGRTFRKVGVVGSGNIGPDIALLFTKVLHGAGTPVVVVDIVEEALRRGEDRVAKKVDRGVESGAFTAEVAEGMRKNLLFSGDYADLEGCDLVVEAATENLDLKRKIFADLSRVCGDEAILASNSSHLEPEAIFEGLAHPERALVIHYFFPAERNRALEIVPSPDTDPDLVRFLLDFYEEIGKAPIQVKSRYGYALDPIFEGIFLASALCVEEGLGTTKEVDRAASLALGLGIGPFTAMNLTGGNPITLHGLDVMGEKVSPWFRSPGILKEAVEKGEAWDVARRGEEVPLDAEREGEIASRLQGAYFGLVCEVLDSGIATLADLEMAVEMGLEIRAPFRLMNQIGISHVRRLVQDYADRNEGFPVAKVLREQEEKGLPWEIPYVLREDRGDVAVVTIRRPRVLNALNGEVFDQIQRHLGAIAEDPRMIGAVITGYGTKAFVSGADVGFLAAIGSPEEAERTSKASQALLDSIGRLGKPVVCAMNGLALGGGNELAMACTARIARKGLAVLAGQPEVNLGIIPGAGGSQRLPRLIGIEPAAHLMRAARMISSEEAVRMGLILR